MPRLLPAVTALVVAACVAACSSTSNGSPTTARSVASSHDFPSRSSGAPSTGGAATGGSATGGSAAGGLTAAQAQAALLTATEVGGGFSRSPSANTDTPLPCTPSDPPLDKQFPPDVNVSDDYSGAGGKALFTEQIETYADTDTVAQVIAGGEKGLSCGTATNQGAKYTIDGPTDLAAELKTQVDKAEGWTVTTTGVNASLIIAQLGRTLVVFSFAADSSISSANLPDAQHLVDTALQKVKAAS